MQINLLTIVDSTERFCENIYVSIIRVRIKKNVYIILYTTRAFSRLREKKITHRLSSFLVFLLLLLLLLLVIYCFRGLSTCTRTSTSRYRD